MFDFTPVGAAPAAVGTVFLVLFYRLVPQRSRENSSLQEAIAIQNYLTEAQVTEKSTVVGSTVADLIKLAQGEAVVTSIMRSRTMRLAPLPDAKLKPGDILLDRSDPDALDRLVARGKLNVTGDRVDAAEGKPSETIAIEAVIGENSSLVGLSAKGLALHDRLGVNLVAVSRRGQRLTQRRYPASGIGDVLVLRGSERNLPEFLRDFSLLPWPSARSCSAQCAPA